MLAGAKKNKIIIIIIIIIIGSANAIIIALRLHGLSWKRSAGRSIRHQQINNRVWRALRRADTPSIKEPSGLLPGEDKRPDGPTLVPWQGGRCLAWDATVIDTLAPSYVAVSAQVIGSAAQAAAERKVSKYAGPSAYHLFVPIAIETLGPINEAGHSSCPNWEDVSRQSQTILESLSLFFSASSFSYKGLMRSHSEALLT